MTTEINAEVAQEDLMPDLEPNEIKEELEKLMTSTDQYGATLTEIAAHFGLEKSDMPRIFKLRRSVESLGYVRVGGHRKYTLQPAIETESETSGTGPESETEPTKTESTETPGKIGPDDVYAALEHLGGRAKLSELAVHLIGPEAAAQSLSGQIAKLSSDNRVHRDPDDRVYWVTGEWRKDPAHLPSNFVQGMTPDRSDSATTETPSADAFKDLLLSAGAELSIDAEVRRSRVALSLLKERVVPKPHPEAQRIVVSLMGISDLLRDLRADELLIGDLRAAAAIVSGLNRAKR